MKKQPEYKLQKEVCKYLELQYPDILFLSDTVANLSLTAPQKQRNKHIQKDGFSCPDILILEPNRFYKGLFIELKTETPFKKDGGIKSQIVKPKIGLPYNHLERQLNSINKLNIKGYKACFSWEFDMTKQIIDNYLKK